MVGNDDGRAYGVNVFRNKPFYPGDDGSQKRKKMPVEPMIEFLKGIFGPGRKEKSIQVKGRKEQEVSHNVVCPEDDCDGKIFGEVQQFKKLVSRIVYCHSETFE
jgi:hypothetical protein